MVLVGKTTAVVTFFTSATVVCGGPAFAAETIAGPVAAEVIRVVDGDTVKVRAQVWLDQELEVSVRISGIDAPELFRPKCPVEKEKARASKQFAESFFGDGRAVLREVRYGKYAGRVVARIENDQGQDLAASLIDEDLAESGPRGNWCKSN